MVFEVVHYGNDPHGAGGIASVLRRHLARDLDGIGVSSVVTYRQDAKSFVHRWTPLGPAIWDVCRRSRSTVVHCHLSQRGSFVREGLVALVGRLTGHAVVVTLHGSSISSLPVLSRRVVRLSLSFVNRVHGFSDAYRTALGIPAKTWVTIPNDVEIPPADEIVAKRRLLLFAGEVGTRKGADILADALSHLAGTIGSWNLVIAGETAAGFRFSAQQESTLGQDDRIQLAGFLGHGELLALMSTAGVLVQPSRAEAFPMSVCEAMARGCCVVGSKVGAMGELLAAAGQVLVDPMEPLTLASALGGLMASPHEIAERGHRARRFAETHLAPMVVNQAWRQVYLGIRASV